MPYGALGQQVYLSPDSFLSPCTHQFQLKCQQYPRVRCQTKFGEVLTFQVQIDRFFETTHRLVQSLPLGDDCYLQAFGDVVFFAPPNRGIQSRL